MSTNIENTQNQLGVLADYLLEVRDEIMESWRQLVDRDSVLQTATHLTRTEFIDHIPIVVATLCSQLRSWPDSEALVKQESGNHAVVSHSQHRWQQGYDLRDLTREWGHLNICLVQWFDRYEGDHPGLQPDVMPEARRILAMFINDGIAQSVIEFYRLLQAEAATRMRELEVGLAHFQQMEKMRGELLRTAVHDLKSSVGAVTGTATLLDDERFDEKDQAIMRNLLKNSASSLEQMLLELMDMARLEAGQEQANITSFDAGRVLTELCRSAQALADERDLYLNVNGKETLTVEGDEVKTRRIAQNLLTNALKYTLDGGVTVCWEKGEDERWILSVTDTGPGLEHDVVAPLAQKLHEATRTAYELVGEDVNSNHLQVQEVEISTTDSDLRATAQGEGIGLSIVKRLCELLDATLELESKNGVGTTFRVLFPCRYATAP